MATPIVLSSSPPRIFARSPTFVESSPGFSTPFQLSQDGSPGYKRFKSTSTTRDGFGLAANKAQPVLQRKQGAENTQLTTPSKDRFKIVTADEKRSPRFTPYENVQADSAGTRHQNGRGLSGIVPHSEVTEHAGKATTKQDPPESENKSPERVVPRRTDWTPPMDTVDVQEDLSLRSKSPVRLSKDLLMSFAFEGGLNSTCTLERPDDAGSSKRRRIGDSQKPISVATKPTNAVRGAGRATKNPQQQRKKAPTKKAMTITHLATSHYISRKTETADSPMAMCLSATQARTGEASSERDLHVKQPVAVSKKAPLKKIKTSKTKLLSPLSALRDLESQHALFGSASQLAREEYEPPLRISSDAISPQTSQLMPQLSNTSPGAGGTSRFVKTRNLWSAADRDEDNALLHTNIIEILDTPDVRWAFAGKDVLVEPFQRLAAQSNTRPKQGLPCSNNIRAGPLSPLSRAPVIGVNDTRPYLATVGSLSTGANQVRATHTAPVSHQTADAPVEHEPGIVEKMPNNRPNAEADGGGDAFKVSVKPNYAEMETEELQSHLMENGLKLYKRRSKILEVLEKFWEDKLDPQANHTSMSQSHGGFLSKVHGLSSRPQPKSQKAGKRTSTTRSKKSGEKSAKPRKKDTAQDKESTKLPSGSNSKAKAPATPVQAVVDIDDLLDSSELGIVAYETITAPSKSSPKGKGKGSMKGKDISPAKHKLPNSLDEETLVSTVSTRAEDDIGTKIRAAIMFESEEATASDRNHVKNPTWHEKILQYDPIILEDLARWLNTEGLRKVHEDNEVSALEVRTWCESNGICCLWRGGWRGQKGRNAED